MPGEKTAFPNRNLICSMEVIETIKSNVEAACSATVPCADIFALAAGDGVFLVCTFSFSQYSDIHLNL
jgi:peroxidase